MIEPSKVLASVPSGLRDPLIKHYREIGANFTERRWEPSELNGGKFCEAAYTILEGAIEGKFATTPSKPRNMVVACRALEDKPADKSRVGDKSLRVLIPKVLLPLYEIRNNRGVGHVGGDVDPNFSDAVAVYSMASWVLAELVRIFHGITTEEAQKTVDALSERKIALIWELDDIKRVQDPKMPPSDQALLLLYGSSGWVPSKELSKWVDYSSASMFGTRVLKPLHKTRLIELSKSKGAHISPLGAKYVESKILKTRNI